MSSTSAVEKFPAKYDRHVCAKRLGWFVVASAEVAGTCGMAPGDITLCKTENPYYPFAVHFFNRQTGGFVCGDYSQDINDAVKAFNDKCDRYNAVHA